MVGQKKKSLINLYREQLLRKLTCKNRQINLIYASLCMKDKARIRIGHIKIHFDNHYTRLKAKN